MWDLRKGIKPTKAGTYLVIPGPKGFKKERVFV
jgi:hypothetical protein